MNLTRLIRIKEKIALSDEFSPQDRDFILEAINATVLLQNAAAVHVNMLRGSIAKPSFAAIKHLYPEEFPDPSYCGYCDVGIELHEDEHGFHHLAKGRRIACAAPDAAICSTCGGTRKVKSRSPERDKAWEVPCPACAAVKP